MSTSSASPPPCMKYMPEAPGFYGYQPSLPAGLIFTILFGSIAIIQLWNTIHQKAWWILFFVAGAGLECLGWIGRTAGHSCAYNRDLYVMQIATLIMGPGYTQAGIYIAVWVLLKRLGQHIFPIPPKTYLWICFGVDVICLALQAVGGGLASAAFKQNGDTGPGTKTMTAGIVSQLLSACLFAIMLLLVYYRGGKDIRASRGSMLLFSASAFATAMMICRNVYRAVELLEGWRGHLMKTESYVIALDATPMLLAMGAFAVVNARLHLRETKAKGSGPNSSDTLAIGSKE